MSKVARAKSHLHQKMQSYAVPPTALQDTDTPQTTTTPPPPQPQLPSTTVVDPHELDRAIHEGLQDSRFGVWSKPAKIALLYLANTKPRFSMSTESAKHIEAGLTREYPELMQSISDKLFSLNS